MLSPERQDVGIALPALIPTFKKFHWARNTAGLNLDLR